MYRTGGWALPLVAVVLLAAPLCAQEDDLGAIDRGGGEGVQTKLGKSGLQVETDGFGLRVTTRVQFRLTYQTEVANGPDGTNGRTFVNFRVRRAVTSFSGFIFDKDFQYKLQLEWTGGNSMIEHAWFRWAIMQYINITAGQAKLMHAWEYNTSSGAQQFVDRGYVSNVFNHAYAKGITLDGKVGEDVSWLKYWVGVYNGALRANTDFRNNDTPINADTFSNTVDGEMMVNLRLETHPLGDVKQSMNDDRSRERFGKVLFAIGLGFNWLVSGFDARSLRGDTVPATSPTASGRFRTWQDTMHVALDGHFRFHGLSIDIEFHLRHTEFHNRGRNKFNPQRDEPGTGTATGNLTDYGFSFLVAYFILPEQLSVGVRWDHLDADEVWQKGSNQAGSRLRGVRPDANELGLSVNYYIHGNNLKLTFDVLMVSQQLVFAAQGTTLLGVYNTPPQRHAFSSQPFHLNRGADYNDLWIMRLQLQWIF
ncbi:MAG: hypothetical protein KF696_09580 [Planctomycetes bacterium]|nr:hypothetical protein [Planctomycetota bacterium]MCW8136108.1 hypothetical protein [Planctomycetota bacterium]